MMVNLARSRVARYVSEGCILYFMAVRHPECMMDNAASLRCLQQCSVCSQLYIFNVHMLAIDPGLRCAFCLPLSHTASSTACQFTSATQLFKVSCFFVPNSFRTCTWGSPKIYQTLGNAIVLENDSMNADTDCCAANFLCPRGGHFQLACI